jgi:hypothetical protein
MRRHELGCTLNPRRVCGMCKMVADEVDPAPPRGELVRVMDEQGFKAMCEAANNCPACILAALRTKNIKDPGEGPCVAGPEDGRESWSYTQAKAAWWESFRGSRADVF